MKQFISVLTFNTSAMLSACFLLLTFNLVAQPTIEWEKNLGGSDSDVAYEVTQTTDGGYIVVGVTLSNDGDVTLNHGVSDGWIVKLNNVGIIEWEKSYGGSNDDVINTILQTTDGGYIAVGFSRSSNGDIVNPHGGSDVWVIKIDALGNINWSKSYGGSGDEKGNSVKQTSDGGYIVAGVTSSSNGDVSINKGLNDYWIFKIDGAGNLLWKKTYGGTGNEEAHSVIQTNDGGYVVAGLTFSVDGDVTNPKGGGDDYWIIRLDSLGILQWEKSYGGSLNDKAYTIQETSDGGFVIVGTSSSKDGDVMSALGTFGFGAWVLKIDSLGALQWEKAYLRIGANTMSFKYVGNLTNDGGYIVTGTTNNGTQVDYWLLKIVSTGILEWEETFGGSRVDIARSVQQTTDGGFIVAGYSASNDGDVKGHYGSTNKFDFWVVKLNPTLGMDEVENNSSIIIYPNPTNGIFTISSTEKINEVEVFNALGKAVYSKKVTSKNITVDLTPFSKGLYFVQLKTNMNSVTKKIVYE